MAETITFSSLDEARRYAQEQGGAFYVTSPDILDRIEAAEEAGGFEGGMTGAAGGGGYTAEGNPGPSFTEGTPEYVDLEGAVFVGAFIEGAIEKFLDARDLLGAIAGEVGGPILLVPTRELQRLMGRGGPEA